MRGDAGARRRRRRDWNAELGADATWVAVSHGDVIKAVLADALGLHLDQFQRIQVDPCSVTVIRYTELRPFVVRINDVGGDASTRCCRRTKSGRGRRREGRRVRRRRGWRWRRRGAGRPA